MVMIVDIAVAAESLVISRLVVKIDARVKSRDEPDIKCRESDFGSVDQVR
jgi:hypothetical protein